MVIQYIIVSIIVIAVLIWQYKTYEENETRIKSIKNLFPDSSSTTIVVDDDNTMHANVTASNDFRKTINDINSYLIYNKNKTFDYQIIKEIVNRNSQLLEDEVDTMITVPLYWGLIATIFGIAFGIVLFAWKDLADLISGTSLNASGIKILLTDVGIAMIASLAGVFFTKQSTAHYNEARTEMVKNKNRFLTWIQTDLMSKLSDDITGALLKMTQDLNEFNRTFANNTQELKNTLSTVKDNYEGQVELIDAINKIKINKIATANIEVYDKLQGCTKELEHLFEIIADSNTYVSKVVELNNNIGSIEERTRLFEELGNYFKNEIEFVRDRQGMMRQQMSSIDSVLQDALSNLGDNISNSIAGLTGKFQQQNERIQLLIEEQQNSLAESLQKQQNAINEKIGQIDNPFEGIKETFEEGIKGIKEAFKEQNLAINEVLSSQKASLETALSSQQQAFIQKLQETPGQLQAISDLSKVLRQLNETLDNQSYLSLTIPNNEKTIKKEIAKENATTNFFKNYYIPICACGSFISLLILLIMKLLGL